MAQFSLRTLLVLVAVVALFLGLSRVGGGGTIIALVLLAISVDFFRAARSDPEYRLGFRMLSLGLFATAACCLLLSILPGVR